MKAISILSVILLSVLFYSCKKPGCIDPTAINYNEHAEKDDGSCEYGPEYENLLVGEITQDRILTADKIWHLGGRVSVTNGATLTIEPGTIIKALAGSGSNACALIIARTGKIDAQGTVTEPIIFTSVYDDIQIGQLSGTNLDEWDTGMWGGVLILGQAPISAGNGDVITQMEGIPVSDPNGAFGGNIPNDNSGIMTYVSIRHGGANIGAGNEINGLSLGGVGSETIINNIEVFGNQDDAIEFFGGTVDVSNISLGYCGDDLIDIDMNYDGTISNFYLVSPGDESIEADGPEGMTHTTGIFNLNNGYAPGSNDLKSKAQGIFDNIIFGTIKIRCSYELDCVTEKNDAASNISNGVSAFTNCSWDSYTVYNVNGCSVTNSTQSGVDNNMQIETPVITDFDKSWTWLYINNKL